MTQLHGWRFAVFVALLLAFFGFIVFGLFVVASDIYGDGG